MTPKNPIENLGESLGEYLREQRTSARLSLRQLADLAGVSNPYLSQIERGLKKPSAEILQELAKGLQISAESLYVKAGFLDARTVSERRPWDVEAAVAADAALTDRQKNTLIDIYRSFIGEDAGPAASRPARTPETRTRATATKKAATKKAATKKTATKKATKKAAAKKAATKKKSATKSSTTSSTTKSAATTTKSAARTTNT